MLNLTAESNHAYYVGGGNGWTLVHNDPIPCGTVINFETFEAHELIQAREIVQRWGGTIKGAPTNNYEAIDGWWNGLNMSLKMRSGDSPIVVMNAIKDAKDKINNWLAGGGDPARVQNVVLFVSAKNVDAARIIDFEANGGKFKQILGEGYIDVMYVLSKDGWMVLRSTGWTMLP
jgi:hypothetical protein